jgi:hypothetical protein
MPRRRRCCPTARCSSQQVVNSVYQARELLIRPAGPGRRPSIAGRDSYGKGARRRRRYDGGSLAGCAIRAPGPTAAAAASGLALLTRRRCCLAARCVAGGLGRQRPSQRGTARSGQPPPAASPRYDHTATLLPGGARGRRSWRSGSSRARTPDRRAGPDGDRRPPHALTTATLLPSSKVLVAGGLAAALSRARSARSGERDLAATNPAPPRIFHGDI